MLENAMLIDAYWDESEYGVPLRSRYDSGEEADYWRCPHCGANLDPDEKCDCMEGE